MNTTPKSADISNKLVIDQTALTVDPAAAPALPKILSPAEHQDLQAQEEMIRKGLETYVEVGMALAAIRDRRLYRAEFGTFEEYCQERWGMTARRARQLWSAADIARNLGWDGNNCSPFALPATESQIRPLLGLPPEQQRDAWAEVLRTQPARGVTAKHVQTVVNRFKGKTTDLPTAAPGAQPGQNVIELRQDRRVEKLRAANRAIAAARELQAMLGTADSVVTAEVNTAVQSFEKVFDHLQRVKELQEARP